MLTVVQHAIDTLVATYGPQVIIDQSRQVISSLYYGLVDHRYFPSDPVRRAYWEQQIRDQHELIHYIERKGV